MFGGGSEAGGTVDFAGRVVWSNARRLWDVGRAGSQAAVTAFLTCVSMVCAFLAQAAAAVGERQLAARIASMPPVAANAHAACRRRRAGVARAHPAVARRIFVWVSASLRQNPREEGRRIRTAESAAAAIGPVVCSHRS